MTELEKIPVEEVVVDPKPSGIRSKIGEDEFIKQFISIVKQGPIWRSATKLADILGVDANDLAAWMDKQTELVKRPGKEEGVVYYAAGKRLETPEEQKRPPGMERKQIVEEDRYVVSMLHMTYSNLVKVLDKYGMHAYGRNKEGFAKLVESRDALSSGLSQLANTLGIDVTKLPNL